MLSKESITRKLGRHILIFPLDRGRIKGVGYNLSVSSFGWSLRTKRELRQTPDGSAFVVDAGDTALVETEETVWVSKGIAGTLHSKVDRVSEGFSSISTTLDPEWIGPLLMAITNVTDHPLELRKGESFTTLILHRVAKAKAQDTGNRAGRTDRLAALGIPVSPEATSWLDEEFRNNYLALRKKLLASDAYKTLKRESWRANLWRGHVLPWLPTVGVFGAVLYVAQNAAPEQQLGPIIAALVAALAIGLASTRRD